MLQIHTYMITSLMEIENILTFGAKIGKVGELEEVDEYRVEAICLGRETAIQAVEALKK
jgi:hypothetical protein